MPFRLFCVLSLLALGIVAANITTAIGATSPKVETTPIPAPPKPDFSSMRFMLGTWTCSTKSSRRPAAYITTLDSSIDPTGYWIVQKSVNHKTAWSPELGGTDMITYDSAAHRWVDIYTGDWAGYNVSTSPGWHGNTIVWTDAVISPTANVASTTPTTVTKVSNSKRTARNTFRESGGRVVTVDATCDKGTGG